MIVSPRQGPLQLSNSKNPLASYARARTAAEWQESVSVVVFQEPVGLELVRILPVTSYHN